MTISFLLHYLLLRDDFMKCVLGFFIFECVRACPHSFRSPFTLTCLSPQCKNVASAILFYEAKDKNIFFPWRLSEMVRIQCRVSRKHYLGSKQTYEYERMSLNIPHRFHSKVKPFLKQDLDMQVTTKGSSLVITLTP